MFPIFDVEVRARGTWQKTDCRNASRSIADAHAAKWLPYYQGTDIRVIEVTKGKLTMRCATTGAARMLASRFDGTVHGKTGLVDVRDLTIDQAEYLVQRHAAGFDVQRASWTASNNDQRVLDIKVERPRALMVDCSDLAAAEARDLLR